MFTNVSHDPIANPVPDTARTRRFPGVRHLVFGLLALAGCPKKEAPPPPPPPVSAEVKTANWTSRNSDGTYEIRQTSTLEGDCQVECVAIPSGAQKWHDVGCRGTTLDIRFPSLDCEKLIVVHPTPARASAIRYAVLVSVWNSHGLSSELLGGGLGLDASKIVSTGNSFSWLAGALERPGLPAHFSEDGHSVELQSLDGKNHVIPFDTKK